VNLEYAEKACQLAPDDLINLSTLGAIYVNLRLYDKAKEIFSRIIEVGADSDSQIVQQAKEALIVLSQ
jgi:hypothetical protein